MSTLLITELFPPKVGGSIRFYWELYRRLPPDRYLIAAGAGQGGADFDRAHALRVSRLPLTLDAWGIRSPAELRAYFNAVKPLAAMVQAERVRMVHCGRCLPEGVMAWAIKRWTGVPYACYVWGEDISGARDSRELTWLAARALKGASYLLTCSQNTARMLVDEWGIAGDRIHLLYPGVDTERFVPAPPDPAVRARLGWGGRTVLLTVARLQKRKGHDQLIQALGAIKSVVPNVLYAIVGDGEERAALEALVVRERLEGHVQFMGELTLEANDLIRCYQQCDLFVLPNRPVGTDTEGFGMVMIEAQACGRPVIGGECGGTPETMHSPETGLVVNCDTPVGLADAISGLLRDPARLSRMGQAARQWTVEQFDWTAVTARASGIFQRHLPPLD